MSLALAFLLLTPLGFPQSGPHLTVFEPSGGGSLAESGVSDVNEQGRVLGRNYENGVLVTFEWTPSGGTRIVTWPPYGAGRLNGLGDVVYAGSSPGTIYHANQTTTLIPPLVAGGETGIYDLNDAMVAVGWADGTGTSSDILVWDPVRGSRSIDIWAAGSLKRVNANTLAVGNITPTSGSSDGYLVDVVTESFVTFNALLGGPWSEVTDVNDSGVVAGVGSHGTAHEAFVWHPSTGFQFLPGLKSGPAMYVRPNAVDNAGRVVGSALTANDGGRAFLWDPVKGIIDLNDLLNTNGFTMTEATDISESGVVIGRGFFGTVWGPSRGFVLELGGTWTDLGFGLAGALGEPRLRGFGTLEAGSTLRLELDNARPLRLSLWTMSLQRVDRPFFGGVMVPASGRWTPFSTDASGAASFVLPGLPALRSGATIYAQAWIRDPSGPQGATASNALAGSVP